MVIEQKKYDYWTYNHQTDCWECKITKSLEIFIQDWVTITSYLIHKFQLDAKIKTEIDTQDKISIVIEVKRDSIKDNLDLDDMICWGMD